MGQFQCRVVVKILDYKKATRADIREAQQHCLDGSEFDEQTQTALWSTHRSLNDYGVLCLYLKCLKMKARFVMGLELACVPLGLSACVANLENRLLQHEMDEPTMDHSDLKELEVDSTWSLVSWVVPSGESRWRAKTLVPLVEQSASVVEDGRFQVRWVARVRTFR